MLAGCIPVTTAAGALPEVVGDAGVVIKEASAEEIARGVELALALDEPARAAARDRVLELFPLMVREEGLEAVVREALEGKDRA
jgi:glycosyltransferase involved in cell wall biosynthesis